MSMNLVTLLYLIASVCFIQALKGLSHPTSSIRGNLFGMVGMAIAVLTTAALIVQIAGSALGLAWVLLGLVIGGAYGAWRAKTVEMTQMPELIAFFHSMIGLAAVCIAAATVLEPHALGIVAQAGEAIPGGNRIELALAPSSAPSPSAARSSPGASCRARASSGCSRARRCSLPASTG